MAGSTPATSARSTARGQLRIRGRKKEMIVTPEGLNVFPEDVEQALNAQPGVRESAVVGAIRRRLHGRARPRGAGPRAGRRPRRDRARRQPAAGRSSEGPRRRGLAGRELPRTEGTRKLKRRELKSWLERRAGSAEAGQAAQGRDSVASVLERFAPGRTLTPDTTIDALGLELARARRADDGARRGVPGHRRRGSLQRRQDHRRPRSPDQPLDSRAGPRRAAVTATESIDFPSWNRRSRRGPCAAPAFRRGSCRSAGSSRASTCAGWSISKPSTVP